MSFLHNIPKINSIHFGLYVCIALLVLFAVDCVLYMLNLIVLFFIIFAVILLVAAVFIIILLIERKQDRAQYQKAKRENTDIK